MGQKSEFCSKTPIGALLILGTNRGIFEILTLKVLKNPKGGPFYDENIFVSDSDETQNLKSLLPEDLTHEI